MHFASIDVDGSFTCKWSSKHNQFDRQVVCGRPTTLKRWLNYRVIQPYNIKFADFDHLTLHVSGIINPFPFEGTD